MAGVCPAQPPAEEGRQLPFRAIELRLHSDSLLAMGKVWTDRQEFMLFWDVHGDGPPPEVAFDKESLIAVFLGSRPNNGYAARIESVVAQLGHTAISYVELLPNPSRDYAQYITHPYAAVVIPGGIDNARFVSRSMQRED